MHKDKRIIIGIILIVFAICLYGLFHDITKLRVFSFLNQNILIERYKLFQRDFRLKFLNFHFFIFLNNYLIDLLWYLSFMLIATGILKNKFIVLIVFISGCISEILQLFFSYLGTFDFFDLGIYVPVTVIFMSLKRV